MDSNHNLGNILHKTKHSIIRWTFEIWKRYIHMKRESKEIIKLKAFYLKGYYINR